MHGVVVEGEDGAMLAKQRSSVIIGEVVAPASELDIKWTEPDEEGLLKFLVERMQFAEERVTSGIKRLKAAKGKASQQRMDSFFTISDTSQSTFKRKPEEKKPAGKGKAKKGKFGKK